jgi:hypothetical protein
VPATDILSRARSAATIFAMNVDEEMGIYRGEVLTIMEALADLRATSLRSARICWRRTMKKKGKKERMERYRREAEKDPVVRRLRELVARGRAELAERRQAEESA